MSTTMIDSKLFYEMLANGYRNLKKNMQTIDDLNVFPVPDGDTGKNMTMTIEGGVSGTAGSYASMGEFMPKFSRNCLLSARGNSGVILSQFIRGIATASKEIINLDLQNFNVVFNSGVAQAYDSVVKPVEGTMLTVIREGGEFLNQFSFEDFETLFERLLARMQESLRHTPKLLPVLKEAGVVDSGGAGVICIIEGMLMMLKGETVDENSVPVSKTSFSENTVQFDENSKMDYGYCTEFILQLLNAKTDVTCFNVNEMIVFLETLGDSIVAVKEDSIVKVHIHTFTPEKVLEYARTFGEFISLKIENMAIQHNEVVSNKEKAPHKKFAIVATAMGKGIVEFFENIGVDIVIDGGQTNNPSAESFVDAFKQLDADYIIVLPNDSNIVMTAKQAADLYNDAHIRVIETKSIAEGYSALSMMDLSVDSIDALIRDMTEYLPNVTTGYVAVSTRDANINTLQIHKGDWLGFTTDEILSSCADPLQATLNLFDALPDIEEKQVITAFYGKSATEEEMLQIESAIKEKYPLTEIGFIEGGQDIQRYIFAIE